MRRELAEDPHVVVGDAAGCVDALVFRLRNTPKALNLLLSHLSATAPHLDLLLETINLSFYEDLVNPETSEFDMLQVLQDYIHREVQSSSLCEEMFTEADSSIAGRLLVLYTQRRYQRKFIKMMLKQTLIRIVNTEDRVLSLNVEEAEREVVKKRKMFFYHSSVPSPALLSNLDEEVYLLLGQTIDTLQRYTLLLLDALYGNLESMPFAMRWLCRTLSHSILTRQQRNSKQDRNRTLGAWVLSRWVIAGVQRADLNGLLWDSHITESNVANFGLIGLVIRHIYSETTFAEAKLAPLNLFISQEMYVISTQSPDAPLFRRFGGSERLLGAGAAPHSAQAQGGRGGSGRRVDGAVLSKKRAAREGDQSVLAVAVSEKDKYAGEVPHGDAVPGGGLFDSGNAAFSAEPISNGGLFAYSETSNPDQGRPVLHMAQSGPPSPCLSILYALH